MKKNYLAIDGWALINKPSGPSSAYITRHIRHLLSAKKAGHSGTLDPFASGVLPIALGEATKTIPYMMHGKKQYKFVIQWGVETDTLDHTGTTIATSNNRPNINQIKAILPKFLGTTKQTPPKYSAVHVQGKRAYHLAREGVDFVLNAKDITIHKLELLELLNEHEALFLVTCEQGMYVRSLASAIAKALQTVGCLNYLERTLVEPFSIVQTISLDDLKKKVHKMATETFILPVEAALVGIPALLLPQSDIKKFQDGQAIYIENLEMFKDEYHSTIDDNSAMYQSDQSDCFLVRAHTKEPDSVAIGLAYWEHGYLYPKRLFNINYP